MLSAIVLLVAAEQLGANKRFLMAVFMLATVGNLIHACQEVYYYHADELREAGQAIKMDYKSVNIGLYSWLSGNFGRPGDLSAFS